MLTIDFLNLSTSKDAPVADYAVSVRVNHRVIHTETIKGHVRADGWKALVARFLAGARYEELEAQLKALDAEAIVRSLDPKR